ncbi:MAG: cytidine deaminase [Candidatus Petromonas sp.]|jgi:cytidine deaminase|nr:cytidine deaminase [Candidatus Petromonas sp.]
MKYKELIKRALEARKNAYVPYSKFSVGAAALMRNGKVYTGCNIECASFGGTNCAERTAIFKAISEGDKDIEAIAVVGDTEDYTFPCGICRQVIMEFGRDIKIIVAKDEDNYQVYTISDLLPSAFTADDLD